MPIIQVEGLSPEEESFLRDLVDEYAGVSHLDFQDIEGVQQLAKGCRRLLTRLTVKVPAKKVSLLQ